MPVPNPTIGELFKAKAVTDEQVSAAVHAFLANVEASSLPIVDGYVVNLDAAIAEHFGVSLLVADEEASLGSKPIQGIALSEECRLTGVP